MHDILRIAFDPFPTRDEPKEPALDELQNRGSLGFQNALHDQLALTIHNGNRDCGGARPSRPQRVGRR